MFSLLFSSLIFVSLSVPLPSQTASDQIRNLIVGYYESLGCVLLDPSENFYAYCNVNQDDYSDTC